MLFENLHRQCVTTKNKNLKKFHSANVATKIRRKKWRSKLKIILFFSLLTAILSSKILGMVFFPSFFLYFFSLDCCRILNFFEFFHNFWLYLLRTLRICHLKSMKLQSVKNLFVLFCEHMLFEVTHFFVYHLINL